MAEGLAEALFSDMGGVSVLRVSFFGLVRQIKREPILAAPLLDKPMLHRLCDQSSFGSKG